MFNTWEINKNTSAKKIYPIKGLSNISNTPPIERIINRQVDNTSVCLIFPNFWCFNNDEQFTPKL